MITCVVDYVIAPEKIAAFEAFGRRWIDLVNRHGGTHHGYYLPSEGASDRALARVMGWTPPDGIDVPEWRC
jgi:hypothetical protein